MNIIRRRRVPAPVFLGYTGDDGYRVAGAPKHWPFGRKRPVMSKAKPRVRRKATITNTEGDKQNDDVD